jgi:Disaggregatase related
MPPADLALPDSGLRFAHLVFDPRDTEALSGGVSVSAGGGNIDAAPCFVEPGFRNLNGTPEDVNDDFWVRGDYHLRSQAGRWDRASQNWVRDVLTSPCIDAGDPDSDWTAEAAPNGGRINMGAYGGTPQASMSLSPVL